MSYDLISVTSGPFGTNECAKLSMYSFNNAGILYGLLLSSDRCFWLLGKNLPT